ncbi:MAG: LLM class flavin-dependent oxidoreductase [Anaerolineales bacterium]|nr:LLM class flavin-dependent oxidoreductase [Anaerolineales bacterium]
METGKEFNLGVMFRREHAPEQLPDFARRAEEAGFGELWVVEDCFYTSGIASAATALAYTDSIIVGLGIMPAVVRNPVFAAMEIATLARLYPGRFLPGFGHGVAGWMKQIGAFPTSQLKALEEVVVTVHRLLRGDIVTFDGTEIHLDQTKLVHPPQQPPPLSLGVRGAKSLALSGRVADGTILAEYAAPEYVAWVREQIKTGQKEAGRTAPHRLTVFAFTCVDADARQQLRPLAAAALAAGKIDAQIAPLGILPKVQELRENGGKQRLEEEAPDAWLDKLAIVGRPAECVQAIHRLVEAGADTVVLVPLPGKSLNELDVFARHLL